jgi:hypothetical protein
MSGMIIKGIYRDRLFDADERAVFDSGWRSNMIVLRCRELLAAFMRNESTETKFGITSLKVGRGDPAWDTSQTANPNPNTTINLVDANPHSMDRSRLTVKYLDAYDQIVPGPTNRIEVVARLEHDEPAAATEPPYPLREFGLFGTFGAQEYMIDYIRHPLIEKDGSVILERRVRLIF